MNNKIQEPLNIKNTADIDIILAVAFNENLAYSDFTKCRLEGGMSRETVIEEMRNSTVPGFEMIILSSRNYSDSHEGNRIKSMFKVKVLDKLASSKQRFSKFKQEILDTHSFDRQKEILEEFMLHCANESEHYTSDVKPIKESQSDKIKKRISRELESGNWKKYSKPENSKKQSKAKIEIERIRQEEIEKEVKKRLETLKKNNLTNFVSILGVLTIVIVVFLIFKNNGSNSPNSDNNSYNELLEQDKTQKNVVPQIEVTSPVKSSSTEKSSPSSSKKRTISRESSKTYYYASKPNIEIPNQSKFDYLLPIILGRKKLTIQWIHTDGFIDFVKEDGTIEVYGYQSEIGGDYLKIEGELKILSNIEYILIGSIESRIGNVCNGEIITKEGYFIFKKWNKRPYFRMQNAREEPCFDSYDYIDIYE